jgi:hypothetical protein
MPQREYTNTVHLRNAILRDSEKFDREKEVVNITNKLRDKE